MKRTIIAITLVIVIFLAVFFAYILRINAQKSCHEAAYWKAYDDAFTPKVDQVLYSQYYDDCWSEK